MRRPEEMESDAAVLAACVQGIERLNVRYGGKQQTPFYLFHRARRWNPAGRHVDGLSNASAES